MPVLPHVTEVMQQKRANPRQISALHDLAGLIITIRKVTEAEARQN